MTIQGKKPQATSQAAAQTRKPRSGQHNADSWPLPGGGQQFRNFLIMAAAITMAAAHLLRQFPLPTGIDEAANFAKFDPGSGPAPSSFSTHYGEQP